VDIDNEISEASLIAIEQLVKKCPNEAKHQLDKLFDIVVKCIKYDPNYNDMDEEDEDMQDVDEDEEGWGSEYYNENQDDDDDTAWKVRKGSVKLLSAMIGSCSSQIYEQKYLFKMADLLASRFKERDNNVKLDILETF